MNLLSRIDNFQKALKVAATKDEMTNWWSEYSMIKYEVEDDRSASKYERDTVEKLGKRLTDLMVAIRDKLPSPDKVSVLILSGALRGSIAARAVGPDGYKMK